MEKAMSVREAGRKGGQTTAKRHGRDFYESIGQKGGKTVSEKYGHEHFQAIGKMGGHKVREIIAAGKAALAEAETEAGA